MDKLRAYLNSLKPDAQRAYAARCSTSVGYLRKACSAKQPLAEKLCIALERESGRQVLCEDLRPEVDWAYIRSTGAIAPVAVSTADAAA